MNGARPAVAHLTACPVAVPAHTTCGLLEVPERRDTPGGASAGASGRTIKVGYAVRRSTAPDRKPDPVVYMSGGPAASSLHLTGFVGDLFPDRDVITVEQRGGRWSQPRLSCPESVRVMLDRLRAGHAEVGAADVGAAADTCRGRLSEQGVDLRGYTTREIVADLAQLRAVLGYASWNLFGVSYSTRVMLDLAAADPAGTRAVVLDSFLPESVDWYGDADRNLADAIHSLGAAEPFEALVTRLNRSPARVPITDPLLGTEFTARLSGDDVATVLAGALHHAKTVAVAPALIHALAAGHDGPLRPFANAVGDALASYEFGLYHAIQCQDEPVFPERSRLFTVHSDRAVCDTWKLPVSAPARSSTDAPALVLGGRHDHTTPARTSRPAADLLPNATFVEFAGVGHSVFLAEDTHCGRQTIAAFVARPTSWSRPCVPDRAALPSVGPGELVVTAAPYRLGRTPWLGAPAALFALMALAQFVTGALRGRALTAFAGLSGLAALGLTARSLYDQVRVNDTALAVGVPAEVTVYVWPAMASVAFTLVALVVHRKKPWFHVISAVAGGGFLIWWFAWFL
ncbi:alpha/beta hydrolase [Nonomuraea longicatena]|uniref:alpha/beta hydrolase n=1 Tax=Nonomuraea longicatena TaxID=83682 RepID=UPI0031D8C7F0